MERLPNVMYCDKCHRERQNITSGPCPDCGGCTFSGTMRVGQVAPAEPREPVAREWLIKRGIFTRFNPNATYAMFGFQITEFMEAYSAELRSQRDAALQQVEQLVGDIHAVSGDYSQARKDVAHWKANHDDQKRRKQNVSRKLSELIKKNRAKKASTSAPEGTV